ncbi:hypothetical protein CLOM_g17330 [Closterium sp. NIES-68]|nr:hypothetical protein CLOM_g17330 [Closterium sp. NIES-68]GJP73151.1 hypothetical protein CLOP_g3890 [Closterium sp. NIES-67]
MQLTVTTADDRIVMIQVDNDELVENVKAILEVETAIPLAEQALLFNGQLLQNHQRLNALGVADNDLLFLTRQQPSQQRASSQRAASQAAGAAAAAAPPAAMAQQEDGAAVDPQAFRQHVLSDPDLMARLLMSTPELGEAIRDNKVEEMQRVLRWMRKMQNEMRRKEQEEQELLSADPFDPEVQRRIEERIQQKNIDENYAAAYEHAPEQFIAVSCCGTATPLSLPQASHAPASRSSSLPFPLCDLLSFPSNPLPPPPLSARHGGSTCCMWRWRSTTPPSRPLWTVAPSRPSCQCDAPNDAAPAFIPRLTRLLDRRYEGIARGVGTSKIVGRIHAVQLKIGSNFYMCSITVLEADNVDFLFGLDMLRRHQCCIDLKDNVLRVGGGEIAVPFLSEKDIPAFLTAMDHDSQPDATTPAQPSQPSTSAATTSAAQPAAPPAAAGTAAGGASSGGGAPASQGAAPGSAAAGAAAASGGEPSPSPSASPAPSAHEVKVQRLMELGFPRHQVEQALALTGGNEEHAAGILFAG